MRFRGSSVHKVPTVFQMEATECGAASLAMILAYYRCYEPLEKLRIACGVSRNGSKASLILQAAEEQYHLEGHGYRAKAEKLTDLPFPSIIFWNANHYVVFEGRRGSTYYINDPARGRCRCSSHRRRNEPTERINHCFSKDLFPFLLRYQNVLRKFFPLGM